MGFVTDKIIIYIAMGVLNANVGNGVQNRNKR